MARMVNKDVKYCRCCNAKAVIIKWSCGCVTVDVSDGSSGWCDKCDNFTNQRRSCGKGGCPAG